MEELEKGKDKIKQICDLLRHDTLEPAQKEAQTIIANAKNEAEKIIEQAEQKAKELISSAGLEIERERSVYLSSLSAAAKQSLDALKYEIEHNLFNSQLEAVINQHMANPEVIAKLINALVKAIEKEGTSANFAAILPSEVSVSELNRFLLEEVRKKLEKSIELDGFSGGVKLRLKDKNLILDVSSKAIAELMERYLRKDFRKWLFADKQ